MITFFHNLGNSFWAKLILGLLGLSMMLFWGLGGLTNLSFQSDNPIQIGSVEITSYQLKNAFETERQKLSALSPTGYISQEQAIQMGLLDTVIQKLVKEQIQRNLVSSFKTIASDTAVKRYLQNQPAFLDQEGKFDKSIFNAYLKQSRTNEQALVRDLREELSYLHIVNAVKKVAYAPQMLVKKMYQLAGEERSIAFVKVLPEKIRISDPSREELQAYYELVSDSFISPETRQITLLKITPETVASQIVLDDQEVATALAEKQKQADIPEKRRLAQMRFDTQERAQQVRSTLNAQNFFRTATEKLGQVDKQTDFGWVVKEEMLEELAEPVFTVPSGTITQPIQSKLGWHIIWVRDIQAPKKANAEKLKAEVIAQLKREKAYDTMIGLTRQLEDKIGSGDTLALAGKDLGLTLNQMEPVDITATTLQGKKIESLDNPSLLQQVFTLKEGETSSVFETNQGYVLAAVDKIFPASQKEYSTVADQVKKMWMAEQQKKKLSDVTAQVLSLVKEGKKDQIAPLGTFEQSTAKGTRKDFEKYPAAVIQSLFTQKEGASYAAQYPFGNGFIVAVVEKATMPVWDEKSVALVSVKEELKKAVADELVDDLLGKTLQKNPVKIDQKEIKKIFYIENAE